MHKEVENMSKQGIRKIEYGINWIWYYTDTMQEAIEWWCELVGKEPYEGAICEMSNEHGKYGFRIHR